MKNQHLPNITGFPEMNTEIVKPTAEMELYFRDYLKRHIKMVSENAMRLYEAGFVDSDTVVSIALCHDQSKFYEPEYTPYVKRKWFERETNTEMYRKMGDDVKDAIVHHVKNNKHHPEYWSGDYRGFDTAEPCHVFNMPERYVIEMICDWTAMGQELGNTARAWYGKTKNSRWIFDTTTDDLIRRWLEIFDKLEYHKLAGRQVGKTRTNNGGI